MIGPSPRFQGLRAIRAIAVLLAPALLSACGGRVSDANGSDAAPGDVLWARQGHVSSRPGGNGDLAITPDGHVVVTSAFEGTADLGGTVLHDLGAFPHRTSFLAALDDHGAPLWNERFLGSMGSVSHMVAVGPDGAIFWTGEGMNAAIFEGPLVEKGGIVKLDASGRLAWNKSYDGVTGNGIAIAVASNGDVVLGGTYVEHGALDFGGGPLPKPRSPGPSVFVARLDTNGGHVWSQSIGAGAPGILSSIAVAHDGRTAVVADVQSATIASDPTRRTIFVFDASGAPVWEKDFSYLGWRTFAMRRVAFGDAGSLLVTGEVDGTIDLGAGPFTLNDRSFVAKYSTSGTLLWSREVGGIDPAMTTDALGNTWLATRDPATEELVITKLDDAGSTRWERRWPKGQVWIAQLACDAAGNGFAFGAFSGTLALDARLTASGDEDLFVAKLAP